ncbi:MAG: hypothetical protein ABIU77_28360 [Ferruginibacter sp.]
MRKLLGIMKFIAAFIIAISFINSFAVVAKNLDALTIILLVILATCIFGIFAYYNILTGLWNFKNEHYKLNVVLVIGLLMHFIITALVLYYVSQFNREVFLAMLPFIITGIIIGVYDFSLFLKAWKLKQLAIS